MLNVTLLNGLPLANAGLHELGDVFATPAVVSWSAAGSACVKALLCGSGCIRFGSVVALNPAFGMPLNAAPLGHSAA